MEISIRVSWEWLCSAGNVPTVPVVCLCERTIANRDLLAVAAVVDTVEFCVEGVNS